MPPSNAPRVAVIGAGISGLACASELAARSIDVRVFEKSRGAGGRMSTRRVDELGEQIDFDHGAQYFTARDPLFRKHVRDWVDEGVAAVWEGRIAVLGGESARGSSGSTERFVGTPGMTAMCKRLSRGLDVRYGVRVERVENKGYAWALFGEQEAALGEYDVVLCSAPAAQTQALLREVAPALAARADGVDMQPCWAAMVAFEEPLALTFDAAFIESGPLSWVANASSKPTRPPTPERWVLHATPAWSKTHLEDSRQHVVGPLIDAFAAAAGIGAPAARWSTAHRWRYALADSPLDGGFLYDSTLGVGACGDWAHGNRVEGAFLSGRELALAVAAGDDAFD